MKWNNPIFKKAISLALHLLFWLSAFLIFTYVFKVSDSISTIDYLYSGLFLSSLLLGVYFNLYVLIPKFFKKEKFVIYLLFFFLTAAITVFLNYIVFKYFADRILVDYYFVTVFDILEVTIFALVAMSTTSLLKLSKSWFEVQKLNTLIIQVEKENVVSQLNVLRAQINPHFLFNSLNVLYSLALKNAEETPEAIIKLSDILRYVIYESDKEKVNLSSEVMLINNYLSLQNYRIDKSSDIIFESEFKEDLLVAPMLFLPLVENSFKHGIKGDVSGTYVHISLKATDKKIDFEIENNKLDNEEVEKESDGGIGIKNIQNRLELLYPERHTFEMIQNSNSFRVKIIISNED